jgi:hypothetical protein
MKDTLFPEDLKPKIEQMFNWFNSILRVSSTKLVRSVVGPLAFGEKSLSPEEE